LDNGELEPSDARKVSYVVFRIDRSRFPPVDYVVSQRVATLLTQLKHTQDNRQTGMLETSFGYLTDTLKAYTDFKNLQRYQELLKKPNRTKAEDKQMQEIAGRPELQPFLPKG
jgi:hypothetical protein